MAYTINLYPSSDISGNNRHSASSGSSLFATINDPVDDDGTTYIYHTLSTSNSTKTSQFNCAALQSEKPSGKIKVRSIIVTTYWGLNTENGNNSSINTRTATLTSSVSFDDSEYIAGTSSTRTTDDNTNYTEFNSTFSNLSIIDKTFNSIDDLNAKLQIYTSGTYTTTTN